MNQAYSNKPKKTLTELRERARASLRGKWGVAILAMLIASFLGAQLAAVTPALPDIPFDINIDVKEDISLPPTQDIPNMTLYDWMTTLGFDMAEVDELVSNGAPWISEVPVLKLGDMLTQEDWKAIGQVLSVILGIALLGAVIGFLLSFAFSLFVGVPMRIGHLRFRLSLIDGDGGKIETLFGGFDRGYLRYVGISLLKMIYVWLWNIPCTIFTIISLGGGVMFVLSLLSTPGAYDWTALMVSALAMVFALAFSVLPLIARYRYAMADYIMAENPDMTPQDALRESTRMMKGNKWRLFCLQLSFIGWIFVGILSCAIGFIWIDPYIYQAEAAFYHEISGREAIREAVIDMKELMAEL